ncbi:hypothetical protein B0T11DRAFT_332683 [Plectosphaerella cucumerina]|uniref:C3H1-type domain-containing protein n=1 Tax=Plectosphaerella cucumerina TaxID=40658 RepID=A0A8K0T3H1_9PEZI|nr:hypothetical protein B0T11DRAFT_332683 [Plectosphaerella cucumerina]
MPSTEFRHARSGSVNIPPQNGHANSAMSPAAPSARFDGPRSPPNTSHVPCKFFRQGACQAGNACPFSHDIGNSAETVCKYFAKGNCKFGPKCANVHILPDGRRINYGKNGVTIGTAPLALGRGQPPTSNAYTPNTTSALTSGLYRDGVPPYNPTYPYGEDAQHQLGRQPSLEGGLPTIDTAYSHPGSNYGSPRDDDLASRLGFGLSPVNKGLSVLDAPLPASFDSQGISNAARYPAAPWPSSVPSKFGLESPTPSLHNAKEERTSETLKSLHTSAFGNDYLSPIAGSSPPATEEYFGKRTMHSSRYAKPKMLSSSLPKGAVDRDWDAEFAFLEEDYVPKDLSDLLTPVEKARRGSIRAVDVEAGSPLTGASPSRWGPLFQRQKEEEVNKHAPSVFGHVGSPLRNSVLSHEMNGGGAGSFRDFSPSTSALTQQFSRTRLADEGGGSPRLHPMMAVGRTTSNGGIGPAAKDRMMERHVSSGSVGSSGRYTTPIDEEDSSFVFNMEEDGDDQASRQRKRASVGMGLGGTTWSYAGVLSGKSTPTSGLAKESREPPVSVETVGGR